MEVVTQSLLEYWKATLAWSPRLALGLIAFLFFWGLSTLTGHVAHRWLKRSSFTRGHRDFFVRAARVLVWIVGFAGILHAIGLSRVAGSVLAGGGIATVVIGFAFKDVLENFIAGFVLAFSRPFNIGDLIQSEDQLGVVKEILIRTTHIRTADGRDVFIPNMQLMTSPLLNYTLDGLRRITISVGIDYADRAADACRLVAEVLRTTTGRLESQPVAANIVELSPQFVTINGSFWIDTFSSDVDYVEALGQAADRTREALAEAGFTFSANVSSALAIETKSVIDVAVSQG